MTGRDTNDDYSNVVRMPKRFKLNIGLIIAFAVLFYVLAMVINYASTDPVVRYEVQEGSLASNNMFRGVILRNEKVVTTGYAGYVNYLAREGNRVAVGDLVFTVDETGSLNTYLEAQNMGENTLTNKELSDFRNEIINYVHSYESTDFNSVYDFKYSLKNTVLKLANTKLLDNISDATADSNAQVKYCYAYDTGIISYWTDGLEDLSPAMVNKDTFKEENHPKNLILSNELRAMGEDVYKLSSSENWSIMIPVEEAYGEELLEEEYVLVRFLKNQNTSWGKVSLHYNDDGCFAELSFTNSMITFTSERYLDIEIIKNEETGLKIPVSAIANKEFFVVDEDFVFEKNKDTYMVIRQTWDENNQISMSSTDVNVYSYNSKDKTYYIDGGSLNAGDILYTTDYKDTYVVSKKGSLTGVYNINRGFTDFKEITILYETDEYAIVKSNTTYGLRVYDYIALDASSVEDEQFIR